MTTRNLTCAELDERLGDYLEGSLDDASVADLELHLSGCPSCTALVRDFERITRDAAALPALTPSPDLWQAIAQRLYAPVADLGAHAAAKRSREADAATHGASRWHRLRLGAVAAGLVGITAISTYYLTNRSRDAVGSRIAAVAPGADSAAATRVAVPGTAESTATSLPGATSAPSTDGRAGVTAVSRAERLPARDTYDAEISSLRGIVSQRREQLDPRTVAVLESSIATIDSAIADARRALEADPASGFLSTQLNKALEKKLGLLRTAALLPART